MPVDDNDRHFAEQLQKALASPCADPVVVGGFVLSRKTARTIERVLFGQDEARQPERRRVRPPARGNSEVTRPSMAAPAIVPMPMRLPVGGRGMPAFGDRFDRRARGDQFCEQCDKLVSADRARRCRSAWCKVRDLASSSAAVGQTKTASSSAAVGGKGCAA